MFLSHISIEKAIDEKKIIITPDFDKKNIRPVGVRIHLAKDILIPEPGQTVSISEPHDIKCQEVDLEKDEFYLEPGAFILGATYESVETDGTILPILDGRSTVARLGITTHITASIVDGALGAPNRVVLEIKNVGNFRIRLKHKDPIAMMCFTQLSEPVVQKVQAQYANQQKVTGPNLNYKIGKD